MDVSSFDKTHTVTSDDMVRGTRTQNFHMLCPICMFSTCTYTSSVFPIPLVYSLSQVFFLGVATTINVYFQAKNENPSSTVVSGKDMSRVLEAPTTPTMALYAFRVTCFVLQGQSMK